MEKQKEENNTIQQLQLKLEEATQQSKLLLLQLQESQKEVKRLDEEKLKLEQQKISMESQIGWYKAKTERSYKEKSVEIDNKKAEIELLLLRDGNPYNDKIKI